MEPSGSSRARISLRDYQRELAERLRQADSARSASKLGVQVGAQSWLVDLVEAGEVLPVPPITAVPLTRAWFRGVANVRGNLYSVVDFAAFLGAGLSAGGEQAQLRRVAQAKRAVDEQRGGAAEALAEQEQARLLAARG